MLAIGSALLGYGLPAHRVAEAVARLAQALGRTCSVFTLPTFLSISLNEETRAHETWHAQAHEAGTHLARLDALHRLVGRVERGELSAEGAERAATAILHTASPYDRARELAAVGLVTVGGVLVLSGELADSLVALGLGLWVGLLLAISASRPAMARILPVVAAATVTALSTMLARLGVLAYPLLAVFASLFVLVPGMRLTLAMTELATGHLVTGSARLVGAVTVFLQLGLGILFGARLAMLGEVATSPVAPVPLQIAIAGSAVLALGFALLFAVRREDAGHTALICALAVAVVRLAGAWLGPEIGALLAASAVALYAHAFARRGDRPSALLSLPGIAMLVPGSLGMLSVSAAVLQDPGRAFLLGFQMVMLLVSLSTGVLLATAAYPPRTAL